MIILPAKEQIICHRVDPIILNWGYVFGEHVYVTEQGLTFYYRKFRGECNLRFDWYFGDQGTNEPYFVGRMFICGTNNPEDRCLSSAFNLEIRDIMERELKDIPYFENMLVAAYEAYQGVNSIRKG